MTPAIQAKSELFDKLGRYSTEDFVYLEKEHLATIKFDVNEIKPMKFKPLAVSYLLSLINWIVEYSFLFAWAAQILQNFTEWRRRATNLHSCTNT
jgi:hypothetical protein